MSDGFRAGIIGAGFIGGVHAYGVRAAGGVVAAVASHSPKATRRAVDVLGAERGAASVEELVAADDVDVVHICTPNHTHAPMTEAALAAGKPVICEKPLATTVSDARRMAELAEDVGVVSAVPFVYRFYPSVREARARIAAGEGGRCGCCTALTCRTGLSRPRRRTGGWTRSWGARPERSGTSESTGVT